MKADLKHKAYTIAVLGTNLYFELPINLFQNLRKFLYERNCRLLYFAGEAYKSPYEYDRNANIIYTFINPQLVDGIILFSNLLNMHVTPEEYTQWVHSFHGIPTVSIGIPIPGIPSVTINNEPGIYHAVAHLVKTHGCRKIGYLHGQALHADNLARFSAFTKAMKDHGLPIHEELLLQGNFEHHSGSDAIKELLDVRGKIPGRDIDALVCANDYMASGVLVELQSRGISIPEDIRITGFDNIPFSECLDPPLSTVPFPYEPVTQKAVSLLMDMLAGETPAEINPIDTDFTPSGSCGCPEFFTPSEVPVLPKELLSGDHLSKMKFKSRFNHRIVNSVKATLLLWKKSLAQLRLKKKWDELIQNKDPQQDSTNPWTMLAGLSAYTFHESNYQNQVYAMGAELVSTLDFKDLLLNISKLIPKAMVSRYCLCLYEYPDLYTNNAPPVSRLISVFQNNKLLELPESGIIFPTSELLPQEIDQKLGKISWIILSLWSQTHQLGYLLLDSDSPHENLHHRLKYQLGSALMSIKLLQESQKANEIIRQLNIQLESENLQIKAEMEIAHNIQTTLQPRDIKNIHRDFEIHAFMLPAQEVGGDYYDVLLDQKNKLWLGIGDVSGHGLKPGLIMMIMQTIHTTITTFTSSSPREALIMINKVMIRIVRQRMNQNRYMTCTLLKYLGRGVFQYAGAHLDLLILRNQSQKCEIIGLKGVWLSLENDISKSTQNRKLKLNPKDILILYSDGITEITNPEHRMLGQRGLVKLIEENANLSIEQMLATIKQKILLYSHNNYPDDMTLLLTQYKGPQK